MSDTPAPEAPAPEAGTVPTPTPTLVCDLRGRLIYDGMVIGEVEGRADGDYLVLNLGWLRLAGIGLRVEADPRIDRQRDGIVLDRPPAPAEGGA